MITLLLILLLKTHDGNVNQSADLSRGNQFQNQEEKEYFSASNIFATGWD